MSAKFHSDLIWNVWALGFFEDFDERRLSNNIKLSRDMRSVPDLNIESNIRVRMVWWWRWCEWVLVVAASVAVFVVVAIVILVCAVCSVSFISV